METTEIKKQNGKPPRALNGIEVLRELADVEAISSSVYFYFRFIRPFKISLDINQNQE